MCKQKDGDTEPWEVSGLAQSLRHEFTHPKTGMGMRTGSGESQWMGTKYNDMFVIKSIILYDSLKKQFSKALYENCHGHKLLEKIFCVVFISLPSHQLTIRSPPI